MTVLVEVLRPTANVWIARSWDQCVTFHSLRSFEWPALTITRSVRVNGVREQRTGLLPPWAFTVCGVLTHDPTWEPGWSDEGQRFAAGPSRGHFLPLRLLNPAFSRPCRRCFSTESA